MTFAMVLADGRGRLRDAPMSHVKRRGADLTDNAMPPVNTIAHSRRVWKTQVIKALTVAGVDINEFQRIIGRKSFGALLNQVYLDEPGDPVNGARVVSARLRDMASSSPDRIG